MPFDELSSLHYPPKPPPDCDYGECRKHVDHTAEVSFPVEIKPRADVGKVETECCGEPFVECKEFGKDACEVTITQKVRVKIPITYRVKTCIGEQYVICCPPCKDDKQD